jgi:uncharacterized protein YjbJ (UPF0337 family)
MRIAAGRSEFRTGWPGRLHQTGAEIMKGTAGIVKGRIEEAAGALVGNDKLRAKGQRGQAAGQVRKDAEQGVRKVKAAARSMVDKAKAAARKAGGRT